MNNTIDGTIMIIKRHLSTIVIILPEIMSGATSIFCCNFQIVRYFITFNFHYRIYNEQSDLVLIIAVGSLQLFN